MARVDPEVKAAAVAALRARRAAGGLSTAQVRAAAIDLGVGERSLWRWLGMVSAATASSPVAAI